MKIKIKKLIGNAVLPFYSTENSAGLDLVATSVNYDEITGALTYGTGLALEIPEGFVGLIFPRSSICNYGLELTNSVGVIDSDYRGEILLKFSITAEYYLQDNKPYYVNDYAERFANEPIKIYDVGDKIGQLIIMPYPKIEFEEVENLSFTKRDGGFGSTGK